MIKRYLLFILSFLILGCGNDPEPLDDILDNPLDENSGTVDYITPAYIFSPNYYSVDQGKSFTVSLFAMGVENLVGASVMVEYDPTVLSLNGVNSGQFATGVGGSQPMFLTTEYPDKVEIVAIYMNDDSVGYSGNVKIADLLFFANSSGSSGLDFQTFYCEMLDPNDNEIEIKGWLPGVVNVD